MHSIRPKPWWKTLPLVPKWLHFFSPVSKLTKYHCLNQAFPSSSLLGQTSTEFVAHILEVYLHLEDDICCKSQMLYKRLSSVPNCSDPMHSMVLLENKSGIKACTVFFCACCAIGMSPAGWRYQSDIHPLRRSSTHSLPLGNLPAALLPHQGSSTARK